nr:phosphotransferase [Actinomadura atramentaria]
MRGNPHYPGQFAAERYYSGLLVRAGVPAPWPYRIDPGADLFGWSYALMPRMPGIQPDDPDVRAGLTADDRAGIARALGTALAAIHAVTAPAPGRYHPAADAVVPLEPPDASVWALPAPRPAGPGPGGPYARWVADRVLARLAQAAGHAPAATTAADRAWTAGLLAENEAATSVPFTPSLVVEDYKEGNTVVARDGGTWRVSGVFDLAQCYFGDGEADLPRTLCSYLDEDPGLARAFLAAYLDARPPRPGFSARAATHLLVDRAMLWEFFQRNRLRWWPEDWTFRDWAGRYLDLLAPLLP